MWSLLVLVSARAWQYTHLGVNGQLWTSARGTRLLIDPILVGELSFFGAPALYTATPRQDIDSALRDELLAGAYDAVVLSQGWSDHAHGPTLRRLRGLVMGPESARPVVEACGLELTVLDRKWCGDVHLRALPGALLGPPWAKRELSILAVADGEPGVYYEPHGDFDGAPLRQIAGDVDVLVAPVVAQKVGGAFDLVRGSRTLVDAAKRLEVDAVVALPNGDVDTRGLAASWVNDVGSVDEARHILAQEAGVHRFYAPATGTPITLSRQ